MTNTASDGRDNLMNLAIKNHNLMLEKLANVVSLESAAQFVVDFSSSFDHLMVSLGDILSRISSKDFFRICRGLSLLVTLNPDLCMILHDTLKRSHHNLLELAISGDDAVTLCVLETSVRFLQSPDIRFRSLYHWGSLFQLQHSENKKISLMTSQILQLATGTVSYRFNDTSIWPSRLHMNESLIVKAFQREYSAPDISQYQTSPSDDVMVTLNASYNAKTIEIAVKRGHPILLEGPASSGKTTLLRICAQRSNADISFIHLDDQIDSRVLIGNDVCSDTPGVFLWKEGVLTRAVKQGSWIVLEDIDKAPGEILTGIVTLLEDRQLLIPSRGEIVHASPGFQLFATLRRANTSGDLSAFVSNYFTRIAIPALSLQEVQSILSHRYPIVKSIQATLLETLTRIRTGFAAMPFVSREVHLRDFFKLCHRLSALPFNSNKNLTESLRIAIVLEIVHVFFLTFPNPIERTEGLVHDLCALWDVQAKTFVDFYTARKPHVEETEDCFVVSGSTLPINKRMRSILSKNGDFSRFIHTKHSCKLLECLAKSVRFNEPLLLVGETGIGKTSVIQYLAKNLGKQLLVQNMSQQTDSSEFLGGFRPLDLRSQAIPLMNLFGALFPRLFSKTKSQVFLQRLHQCFQERNWNLFAQLLSKFRSSVQDQFLPSTNSEKNRKTLDSDVLDEWNRLCLLLDFFLNQLHAISVSQFAFGFVDGSLVKALREGHWILLDEINLASAESLQRLCEVLEGPDAGLTLLEKGTSEMVKRHPDFRIFASMNPATDFAKRDLPAALRERFTEVYVEDITDPEDLEMLIQSYLNGCAVDLPIAEITEFFLRARELASTKLSDGSDQRPHFSIRSLCRSLVFCRNIVHQFGFKRALFEGISVGFLSPLNDISRSMLMRELVQIVFARVNMKQLLSMRCAEVNDAVDISGFWIPQGPLDPHESRDFVRTVTIEKRLGDIARIIVGSRGRYPILLQGPTSAGKTTIVKELAALTCHKCVRINNHEHTDVQEYFGSYNSTDNGAMVFQEGILVEAARHGYWVILDELNLAPADVLEALNRLLDDNRELIIPETQEVIHPHPHFMLFATQNPPGLYGGRKNLSRAFRNRFVELDIDEIPHSELVEILEKRCILPPSYCKKMIETMVELQKHRQSSRIFAGKHAFMTSRDLFKWGRRSISSYDDLAAAGFSVVGERLRSSEERHFVAEVLSSTCRSQIDFALLYGKAEERAFALAEEMRLSWTSETRRLFSLVQQSFLFREPSLLVGETGNGKTTVVEFVARLHNKQLWIVNCHESTESADFLGSIRPLRAKSGIEEQIQGILARHYLSCNSSNLVQNSSSLIASIEDSNDAAELSSLIGRYSRLFEWADGPLVKAMKQGDILLIDEISLAADSVLERLNSVLEDRKTLLLSEKGGDHIEQIEGHPDFTIFATMNPGGDFGKRELSPALRNRFTEIWVPKVSSELELVISNYFSNPLLAFLASFIAQFVSLLESLNRVVSLRDLKSWVVFIETVVESSGLSPADAYAHGARMNFLDGLSTGTSESAGSCRTQIAKLAEFVRNQCHEIEGTPFCSSLTAMETENAFGQHPFFIEKGPFDISWDFNFDAPTTGKNLERVLRAMQLPKALLLEGSPGVGKTSLISSVAAASGHRLVRINLSEQTDMMDLLGSDYPKPMNEHSDGGFQWCDGLFLSAIRQGDWVLLDELNLASQTVLEGLNSILDHRSEIFIPELNETISCPSSFRLFACQNPVSQGGGRKSLPKSFLNRFTKVFLDELSAEDLHFITMSKFPSLSKETLQCLIAFNTKVHERIVVRREFGLNGSPWEFNLRDVHRFCSVLVQIGSSDVVSLFHAMKIVYAARLRSNDDKTALKMVFEEFFGSEPFRPMSFEDTDSYLRIGLSKIQITAPPRSQRSNLELLHGHLKPLECMLRCIEMDWPVLLTGPSASGKTSLVRLAHSKLNGADLFEFAVSETTDASDLLGGFHQLNVVFVRQYILDEIQTFVARCIGRPDIPVDKKSSIYDLLACASKSISSESLVSICTDIMRLIGDSSERITHLLKTLTWCEESSKTLGCFEWVDGALIRALESGSWFLLENANLCPPSVLDRLNGLLEPNGCLVVSETGLVEGIPRIIYPHPDFRIFLTTNPQFGEVSRAMRNRCIEIFIPVAFSVHDKRRLLMSRGICGDQILEECIRIHDLSGSSIRELLVLADICCDQLRRGQSLDDALREASQVAFASISVAQVPEELSFNSPIHWEKRVPLHNISAVIISSVSAVIGGFLPIPVLKESLEVLLSQLHADGSNVEGELMESLNQLSLVKTDAHLVLPAFARSLSKFLSIPFSSANHRLFVASLFSHRTIESLHVATSADFVSILFSTVKNQSLSPSENMMARLFSLLDDFFESVALAREFESDAWAFMMDLLLQRSRLFEGLKVDIMTFRRNPRIREEFLVRMAFLLDIFDRSALEQSYPEFSILKHEASTIMDHFGIFSGATKHIVWRALPRPRLCSTADEWDLFDRYQKLSVKSINSADMRLRIAELLASFDCLRSFGSSLDSLRMAYDGILAILDSKAPNSSTDFASPSDSFKKEYYVKGETDRDFVQVSDVREAKQSELVLPLANALTAGMMLRAVESNDTKTLQRLLIFVAQNPGCPINCLSRLQFLIWALDDDVSMTKVCAKEMLWFSAMQFLCSLEISRSPWNSMNVQILKSTYQSLLAPSSLRIRQVTLFPEQLSTMRELLLQESSILAELSATDSVKACFQRFVLGLAGLFEDHTFAEILNLIKEDMYSSSFSDLLVSVPYGEIQALFAKFIPLILHSLQTNQDGIAWIQLGLLRFALYCPKSTADPALVHQVNARDIRSRLEYVGKMKQLLSDVVKYRTGEELSEDVQRLESEEIALEQSLVHETSLSTHRHLSPERPFIRLHQLCQKLLRFFDFSSISKEIASTISEERISFLSSSAESSIAALIEFSAEYPDFVSMLAGSIRYIQLGLDIIQSKSTSSSLGEKVLDALCSFNMLSDMKSLVCESDMDGREHIQVALMQFLSLLPDGFSRDHLQSVMRDTLHSLVSKWFLQQKELEKSSMTYEYSTTSASEEKDIDLFLSSYLTTIKDVEENEESVKRVASIDVYLVFESISVFTRAGSTKIDKSFPILIDSLKGVFTSISKIENTPKSLLKSPKRSLLIPLLNWSVSIVSKEAGILESLVRPLVEQLCQLLVEFTEHPILQQLLGICNRILDHHLDQITFSSILSSLHLLLGKSEQWEINASKRVSLERNMKPLRVMVARLRKAQLDSWESVLEQRHSGFRKQSATNWFKLVYFCERFKDAQALELIEDFLRSSSAGNFATRISMVRSTIDILQMSSSLRFGALNLVAYYKQFLTRVESFLEKRAQPLKKEIKEQCKLQRWDVSNFNALESSSKKAQSFLHRMIKQWDEVLRFPFSRIELLESELCYQPTLPFNILNSKDKLDDILRSVLLLDFSSVIASHRQDVKLRIVDSREAPMMQKKRALSDLLKLLRAQGFRFQNEEVDRSKSFSHCPLSYHDYVDHFACVGEKVELVECDQLYFSALYQFEQISLIVPHKDLSPAEAHRIKSICRGLLGAIVLEREHSDVMLTQLDSCIPRPSSFEKFATEKLEFLRFLVSCVKQSLSETQDVSSMEKIEAILRDLDSIVVSTISHDSFTSLFTNLLTRLSSIKPLGHEFCNLNTEFFSTLPSFEAEIPRPSTSSDYWKVLAQNVMKTTESAKNPSTITEILSFHDSMFRSLQVDKLALIVSSHTDVFPIRKCIEHVLAIQTRCLRELCHLSVLLFRNAIVLLRDGFCRKNDEDDKEDDGESTENAEGEGTGMGEGVGTENVSDQIENQEQLEGLRDEATADEEEQPDDPVDPDDGFDMDDDFDGDLRDMKLDEDEEDEDKEDADDLEDAMDSDDQQLDDVVDEKFWDDDKEEDDTPDKDEKVEDDGGVDAPKEDQLAADSNEDDKTDKDKRDNAIEDPPGVEEKELEDEKETDDIGEELEHEETQHADLSKEEDENSQSLDESEDPQLDDVEDNEANQEDEETTLMKDDESSDDEPIEDEVTDADAMDLDVHEEVGEEAKDSENAKGTQEEMQEDVDDPNAPVESENAALKDNADNGEETQVNDGEEISSKEDQSAKPTASANPLKSFGDAMKEFRERLEILKQEQKRDEKSGAAESSVVEHVSEDQDSDAQALAPSEEQKDMEQDPQSIPLEIDQEDTRAEQEALKQQRAAESNGRTAKSDSATSENDIEDMSEDFKPEKLEDDIVMLENLIHSSYMLPVSGSPLDDFDTDSLRGDLIRSLADYMQSESASSFRKDGENRWRDLLYETDVLSQNLCERLRVTLEPLQSSKFKGDYRSGKRLNMKRVISYIASQFRKDKIWLRRTKPSKRSYQILLGIDNSKSMLELGAGSIALKTLASLIQGLNRLEVGDLAVMSFGDSTRLLHDFGSPVTSVQGGFIANNFDFSEENTQWKDMLGTTIQLFDQSRWKLSKIRSNAQVLQIAFIVSDARIQEDKERLKSLLAEASAKKQLIVLIVIDSGGQSSIVHLKSVEYSEDGQIKVVQYLDDFPFPYFLILRNMELLPSVIADGLKQWFELIQSGQI